MQLNPVIRRDEESSQTIRYTHKPAESEVSPPESLTGFNSANWILELPDPLLEMKDFHFAISASIRMAQSMGDDYLFDEVR